MIDPKLEGKVALITGANHGIGAATARALAEQGVKVFISYYLLESPYSAEELVEAKQAGVGGDKFYHALQQQSADGVVAAIEKKGGTAVAHLCDLGDITTIPDLFDRCEATLGPVDILIANHTHCELETFDPSLVSDEDAPIRMTTAEGIDRHFAVNARGTALLIDEYTQRHLARKGEWGRIITLTTSEAHAYNISYAASKAAVVSYTKSAAQELGKYGITANVVCPGPTQTGYITPEAEKTLCAQTPLGRLGQAEDIADVILFLASEQGRWMTGQHLYATGGFMACG